MNVIVIKNVAAISASFVSFRIKQTLFNTRKTSKSKFEIFHFNEEFCKDLKQMILMIKAKHAFFLDITINFSLRLNDRHENVQQKYAWKRPNI